MLPHRVHMRRRHPVATEPILHLHLAGLWTRPPQEIILRLHLETAMASLRRLHQHRVHGTYRHQRRVERILVTTENDRDCITKRFVYRSCLWMGNGKRLQVSL